jgi:hypothetical protein
MRVRGWVVSGLIVAVVTAVILVLGGGSPEVGPPKRPGQPQAPSPLSEQEVRTYLAVWPQINQVLAATLGPMGQRHETGLDEAELGRQVRAAVDAILLDHHLSQEGWSKLRNRVEHAVDVVRWRDEAKERNAGLDSRIQQKEALLELAEGKAKELLQKDIAALKEQRVAKGPPLLQRDVDLVRSFWADLDRITPARGSPPKDQKQPRRN